MNAIGDRYNRMTVLDMVGKTKHGDLLCECVCDCGTHKIVQLGNLRSGHTKSCGCLDREKRAQRNKGNVYGYKHGHSAQRIYGEYHRMIERCKPDNKTHHERYYDRGITVCQEWADDMDAFIAWSEQSGYDDTLTLDRIDNDKGYSPNNCRWVTMKEQSRNKSDNRNITFEDQTMCITAWAERVGIDRYTLYSRVSRGWPVEATLHAPKGTRLKDWMREHNEEVS